MILTSLIRSLSATSKFVYISCVHSPERRPNAFALPQGNVSVFEVEHVNTAAPALLSSHKHTYSSNAALVPELGFQPIFESSLAQSHTPRTPRATPRISGHQREHGVRPPSVPNHAVELSNMPYTSLATRDRQGFGNREGWNDWNSLA